MDIRNVMRNNLLGDLTNKQEARGKKRGDTTPRLKNPAASKFDRKMSTRPHIE
jgi:hypothetical protein